MRETVGGKSKKMTTKKMTKKTGRGKEDGKMNYREMQEKTYRHLHLSEGHRGRETLSCKMKQLNHIKHTTTLT